MSRIELLKLLTRKTSIPQLAGRDYRVILSRDGFKYKMEIVFVVRSTLPGFYTINFMLSDRFGQVFLSHNVLFRLVPDPTKDNSKVPEIIKNNYQRVGKYDNTTTEETMVMKSSRISKILKPEEGFYREMMSNFLEKYYV